VQQVADLHLKFALRPQHVWKYGRHPIAAAEFRRGKKEVEERRRKIEITGQNIMVCPIT